MRFSRRQLFKTTGGVLAYATATSVLKRAGIAQEPAIRVGNILDKTGVSNRLELALFAVHHKLVDGI